MNEALLATNEEHRGLVPATALAAMHIVENVTQLRSCHVVVLGRGRTVGRPFAQMAINRNATITVCYSHTATLAELSRSADIVVGAMGKPGLIRADFVREGQFVVDCGIAIQDGVIVGDVDARVVRDIVKSLTLVPGGVGVLTNSFLLSN